MLGAYKNFKNTKSIGHWNYYKELRNFTTSAIRNEKRAYLETRIKLGNPKLIWKDFRAMNITKSKRNEIPVEFTDANEINSFFVGAASVALGCVSTNGLSAYYNDNFRLNLPKLFE
ncbi:hypothetical protein QE152_g38618 [Popillia japonica]|uniref:Uncharacterized protein n=1 Tax=Popillia japonica TaxID=7064 RepID=A0AAW1HVW2_POPJA